jgi:hypothetical protein
MYFHPGATASKRVALKGKLFHRWFNFLKEVKFLFLKTKAQDEQ